MAIRHEEVEHEKITFPKPSQRGFILGLDPIPAVVVLAILMLAVAVTFIFPFPIGIFLGLLFLPVAGVLGWGRWEDIHIFGWIRLGLGRVREKLTGQDTYVQPDPSADAVADRKAQERANKADARAAKEAKEWDEPVPAKTPKPLGLNLPGAANELKLYRLPSGAAVVHNPLMRRLTICARVEPPEYLLQDDTGQADILTNWATIIDVVGGHDVVDAIFGTDITEITTGQMMQDFYTTSAEANDAGEKLNPVAHAGYLDMLAKNVMTHHPKYLVVNLSLPKMKKDIKMHGSGVNGMLAAADEELRGIEEDLNDNHMRVAYWMDAEKWPEVIYEAFSPSNGDEYEDGGWGGPQAGKRDRDTLRTDRGWHRSYVIRRLPQRPVNPGFMEKLVFAGEFRHAVTISHKRGDDERALRNVNNQLKDTSIAEGVADRVGKRWSLSDQREAEDLHRQEAELVAGSTATDILGYVSITADSEEQLDRYERQMRSAAARADVRLRVCYWQQFQGFLAATALLGFGRD